MEPAARNECLTYYNDTPGNQLAVNANQASALDKSRHANDEEHLFMHK